MHLSDETIVGEVLRAFRRMGMGEASLPAAAEACFRTLLDLSHERPATQGNPPCGISGDPS